MPRNLDFRWRLSQQYQRRLGVAESDVLRTRLFGDLRGQIWRLDAQLEPWQRNAPGPARSRERQSQVGFRLMPPRLPQLDLRIDRLDRDTQSGLSSSERKRVQVGWSRGGVSTEAAFRRIDAVPAGIATAPSRTEEWRGGLHVVRASRRASVEGGYEALVSDFRSHARRRSLDTQRVQLGAGWTPVRQVSMQASFFDRWGRTEDNAQPGARSLDEVATAANLRVRPGAGFEMAGTHEYRRQSSALGDVVSDYVQVEGLFRRDVRRGLVMQTGYLGTMRLGGGSGDVPHSNVYGFLDGRLLPRIDGHAETRASRARGEGVGGTQWHHALQARTRPTRRTKLEVGWNRQTLPEILGVAQHDRRWEIQGGWDPGGGASLVAAWRRLDGHGRIRRAERFTSLTGSWRPSESTALSASWSRQTSRTVFGSRLYPEWKEERRVRLGEEFVIGDTDNSAIATRLLPDFRIIDGKPTSLSTAMANPAARIIVREKGAAVDSAWAFLNFPPHFSPRSFFTFKIKKVAGYPVGQPSVTSPDAVTVGRE
jgi:hypothetical protein